jgi:hypothetical protein
MSSNLANNSMWWAETVPLKPLIIYKEMEMELFKQCQTLLVVKPGFKQKLFDLRTNYTLIISVL